jgi:Fe-S-cluster containining protein
MVPVAWDTARPRNPAAPQPPIRKERRLTDMEPTLTPLAGDGRFRFGCSPAVPCFNDCCRDLNQALTPYDVLRLKNHLKMPSERFLAVYTSRHTGPDSGLPVVTLSPVDPKALTCPFVTPRGCRVYPDRPASCRAYPVARALTRCRDTGQLTEHFALLREPHCRGFDQAPRQTVSEWVAGQGLGPYNRMNDRLMEIIRLKNRTVAGPLDLKSQTAFYGALYDLDGFRTRLFVTRSLTLRADGGELQAARNDDTALLALAIRWVRETLFPSTNA